MKTHHRKTLLPSIVAAGAVAALVLLPVQLRAEDEEGEGGNLPTVINAVTAKECSACHMAFQPIFLPRRSWVAIMDNLKNHFGEDASLPPEVADEIRSYLVANAGEHNGWTNRIPATETPTRISETPGWIAAHSHEVPASAFTDPKVKSKANCVACHQGADQGIYGD